MSGTEDLGAGSPPHHLLAAEGVADERTRVLKHDDTFVVFDHLGDIKPGGLGEEGLYHEGTRYLSCLLLELDGQRPFFLRSTVREENDQLTVDLTNPDRLDGGRVQVPLGTLHLELVKFLWRGACHQQIHVRNLGSAPVRAALTIRFRADFADIFEVRGMKRKARGVDLPPEVSAERVVLGYRGLDGEERRTVLTFDPPPTELTAQRATFALLLAPGAGQVIESAVCCVRGADGERGGVSPPSPQERLGGLTPPRSPEERRLGGLTPPRSPFFSLSFSRARAEAEEALLRHLRGGCQVRSSSPAFTDWVRRAESDLHMMVSQTPTGSYPYAGVPWFNTPFGRDGLVTALETLWLRPELARGVLAYLASTQSTSVDPEQDAEPGKILHETRNGEMAVLKEMPFGRYYGSVDATPLFVLLAGAYHERTADRDFIEAIWPNVEAALAWVDEYGDLDGDGLVEYARRSADGLLHQGWKDSDDAIFHADGSPAAPPIALCEVQGYVYAAKQAAAALANVLGLTSRASALAEQAEELRQHFEESFWCDDLGIYALALDGEKRPCRVLSSNAGQCLFTGIASPERARRVARHLTGSDFFSGWGVRTVAARQARYNPLSYHNGSIWPHDNALLALGLSRYGLQDEAARLLAALFEAGRHFELGRMPELFCGFPRQPDQGPVPYPVACSPQAWAAGSVFLLLQACLGLSVDAAARQVCFTSPRLPDCVDELRIHQLAVSGASVDLQLVRHGTEVGVNVLGREGDVQVLVVK